MEKAGVVTVGRKQYAAGLYWENSPSGRVSQAAKEAARQPGNQADFFAVRAANKAGRLPQFGLSHASAEHKSGMPVLAACLANQQPGTWVGAFKLREGVSVVVVRDDLIVPDGDQFYLDETEARDRILQEIALGGIQRIYAPEPWGVPGADTMPVSLLLNERTDVRLQSIALSQQAKIFLMGAGVFLLLLLGIGWYIQKQNAEEEAEANAKQAALEQARLKAQQMMPGFMQAPVEYPPPERKWEKRPNPMNVVSACQVGLSQVPMAVAGWTMGTLSCSETGVNVGWSRTMGFSSPPPKTTLNETGGLATGSYALPNLTPRGAETLWDPEAITRRYLAQNWPGMLSRAPDDPPPPPPPDYKGNWSPPPAPWVKRSFTLSVPVLPGILPGLFEGVPGIVVNSMSYMGSGTVGSWTINGVIYENRR